MFTKVMKEELIAGLLKIFGNNISMIILYGSVARNEYTDESDIDIAIILKNEIDNKTKEQFILLQRYLMGKTQMEISDELGISQAQVSRIEKNALSNVKKLIK